MESFLFYLLSFLSIAGAITVVAARNPINGALALIGTFICVAGIYVLLEAHFLAIIQVLVYAGAVMVLFIFVIMFLNLNKKELTYRQYSMVKFLSVMGVILFGAMLFKIFKTVSAFKFMPVSEKYGSVEAVGQLLFTNYVFPFEVVSILLLVAMVGAVVLAKKRL